MSAISGFISTIRNAVYGEQVRGAIADAIAQCYDDVSNPSLNTAAFATAVAEAYEDGFLDIQEKSTIAGMTNEKIIYRYTGNQSGYIPNALYYYNGTEWVPIGSGLQSASSSSLMTNQNVIYKYTGSESGYVTGKLYYHDGSSWVILNPDPPAPTLPDDFKSAMMTFIRNMSGTFTDTNGAEVLEQLAITLGDSLFYQKNGRTLTIAEYSDVSRDGFSNGQLTLS